MDDHPKKQPPGRPRTVNREQVIHAAMENYWTEGIRALSLNEMCRRAGLSKPALYRDFGGEDGLMAAALEHYDAQVVRPVLEATRLNVPFSELLERLIVGTTTASGPPGCMFTEMRFRRHHLGEATLARINAMEARRLEVFEVCIERAAQAGHVSPNVPPALAARYLDTQLATMLMQLRAGQRPADVAEQARLAFQSLLP